MAMDVTSKSHHVRQELCESRPPYRAGRKLTAVKVYTVSQESVYLLVQGVPQLGVIDDLLQRCALYGAVDEYRVLHEYPAADFTEVVWVKFQRLAAARVAKRRLDDEAFFGGILHVCYAAEYESVAETRVKLRQRRREVARRTLPTQSSQLGEAGFVNLDDAGARMPIHSAGEDNRTEVTAAIATATAATADFHVVPPPPCLPPPYRVEDGHRLPPWLTPSEAGRRPSEYRTGRGERSSVCRRGVGQMSEYGGTATGGRSSECRAETGQLSSECRTEVGQVPAYGGTGTGGRSSECRAETGQRPPAHSSQRGRRREPSHRERLTDLRVAGELDIRAAPRPPLRAAPPRFTPRQVERRSTGAAGDGARRRADDVLRANACTLGAVHGPVAPAGGEKRKRAVVDVSFDATIATVRETVKQLTETSQPTAKKKSRLKTS